MKEKMITVKQYITLKEVLREISWAMIFEPNLGSAHKMLEKVIDELSIRPKTTGENHE